MRRLIAEAIATFAPLLRGPAAADILMTFGPPMTGRRAGPANEDGARRRTRRGGYQHDGQGGLCFRPGGAARHSGRSCDPEQAVAATQILVSQRVIPVVGHFCSGASIAASDARGGGELQISPVSSNPLLTELCRANVFRVAPATMRAASSPATMWPIIGPTRSSPFNGWNSGG